MVAQEALPDEMREATRNQWQVPLASGATKQIAGKAPAHAGFDDMAPPAALLALRICESYSTRLAPCIRGHLVRNAAHEGFCISLLACLRRFEGRDPDQRRHAARARAAG